MTSISIKSEIDSRVVLYPLMRCLAPLGSCLIITSNKQVSRLIDNEYDGDFRNFRVLVDLDGGTDDLLAEAHVTIDSYAFVVYDNVGVVEQNKLIIPIGPIISEVFESEMLYLGEDRNTHILRFGKPVPKKNTPKPKQVAPISKDSSKSEESIFSSETISGSSTQSITLTKPSKPNMSDEEIDNAARLKFQPKKEDVMAKLKKLPNLEFPKFEDIEMFESNKRFFDIDKNFIKFFYTVFQDTIGLKEPNFMREVTRRDASSSDFSQRPASGENSIELDAR